MSVDRVTLPPRAPGLDSAPARLWDHSARLEPSQRHGPCSRRYSVRAGKDQGGGRGGLPGRSWHVRRLARARLGIVSTVKSLAS